MAIGILTEYLSTHEDELMQAIRACALEHGYSEYTSTALEPWRISIQGLTEGFTAALNSPHGLKPLSVHDEYNQDPATDFGRLEAERHRKRGIPLPMFMGFFKYYRKVYLDMLETCPVTEDDKREFQSQMLLFFDRIEIAYADEWCKIKADMRLRELQETNRELANSKNSFLSIFESFSEPVVLTTPGGLILNANHKARNTFQGMTEIGKAYYQEKQEPTQRLDLLGISQDLILKMDLNSNMVSMELETIYGQRMFTIRFRRLLDYTGRLSGFVLEFSDITETVHLTRERIASDRGLELLLSELRQADSLKQQIIQSIPIPFFIVDHQNNLVDWNDAFIHYFSSSPAGIKKPRISELISRDFESYIKIGLNRVRTDNRSNKISAKFHIRNRPRFAELLLAPVANVGERDPRTIVAVVDFTESQEKEDYLRKLNYTEHCLSLIASKLLKPDPSPIALSEAMLPLRQIAVADRVYLCQEEKENSKLRMKIVEANESTNFPAAFPPRGGYLGEEFPVDLHALWQRNEPIHLPLNPDRILVFPPDYRRSILEGLYFPLYWGKGKRGVLVFERLSLAPSWTDDEIENLAIAARFVQAFLQLNHDRSELRLLASAIDATEDGIVITEGSWPKGGPKIVFASQGFCRMTGYSREELIGRTPGILQSEKTNRSAIRELKKKLLIGESFHGENTNRRKDGSFYDADWRVNPVSDSKGEISHFISVQRDNTEQKAIEARKSLSTKLESIGQLAAGIAHEINTPSQFINDNLHYFSECWSDLEGLLKHLVEHPEIPVEGFGGLDRGLLAEALEEIPEALKDSISGVERIKNIVSAMREFSHPSDEKGPNDINHAIRTTMVVARNEWKYCAEMELDLDPSLPLVHCIPGEINQVILNLIVNSAHAIEERFGKDAKKGKIRIKTSHDSQFVRIEISDNGCGIPDEIRQRVFDPFFTTKDVGRGTGQGLYLSRTSIVNKHGGRMNLESTLGKGTSFYLDLPLEDACKPTQP